MENDKKMSRGKFLSVMGGMAVAAVAFKLGTLSDTVTAVLPGKVLDAENHVAYGGKTYGGTNA